MALKQVRELFRNKYSKAKPEQKSALAGTLLKSGRETKDDAAIRYVLFREARDLAGEADAADAWWDYAEKPPGLDPADRYESAWIGGRGGGPETPSDGRGRWVVGIHGRARAVVDALGL